MNEIRAIERLGSQIMEYSQSPLEPPPHQSIPDDAAIPLHYLPRGFLHFHAHSANDPAQVAHFASLMSGVPFTITAHAGDLRLTSTRVRVLRWRARAAAFISASTACDARYLRDVLKVNDKGKVRLIHHGIDLTA